MNIGFAIYDLRAEGLRLEIRSSLRDFLFFIAIPAVETAGYCRVFLRNKVLARVKVMHDLFASGVGESAVAAPVSVTLRRGKVLCHRSPRRWRECGVAPWICEAGHVICADEWRHSGRTSASQEIPLRGEPDEPVKFPFLQAVSCYSVPLEFMILNS